MIPPSNTWKRKGRGPAKISKPLPLRGNRRDQLDEPGLTDSAANLIRPGRCLRGAPSRRAVRWAAGPARSLARGRGDPGYPSERMGVARPTPGREGWGTQPTVPRTRVGWVPVAASPSEGHPGGRRPAQIINEIRKLPINLAATGLTEQTPQRACPGRSFRVLIPPPTLQGPATLLHSSSTCPP